MIIDSSYHFTYNFVANSYILNTSFFSHQYTKLITHIKSPSSTLYIDHFIKKMQQKTKDFTHDKKDKN